MQEIIDKLKTMINIAKCKDMTSEQENYLAGIADALQIVEEAADREYEVDKWYYVILFKGGDTRYPYAKQCRLSRINKTKCTSSYSFVDKQGFNMITLHSKVSLQRRVFKYADEAKRAIELSSF